MRVTVNGLKVRTGPSISAPQLVLSGAPVVLYDGDDVFLIGPGPVADGYQWFMVALEVDPLEVDPWVSPIPVAWIAGGTQADHWLFPAGRGPCPTPTVSSLAALPELERAVCGWGSISLTVHQAAALQDEDMGSVCGAFPPQPAWLFCEHSWVNDGGNDRQLLLHFDPATGISPIGLAPPGTDGATYDVTGHFDDPASEECVTADDRGSVEANSQYFVCAAEFVVESLHLTTSD